MNLSENSRYKYFVSRYRPRIYNLFDGFSLYHQQQKHQLNTRKDVREKDYGKKLKGQLPLSLPVPGPLRPMMAQQVTHNILWNPNSLEDAVGTEQDRSYLII